jgi:hypothetical protein
MVKFQTWILTYDKDFQIKNFCNFKKPGKSWKKSEIFAKKCENLAFDRFLSLV